jgi:hypothetical protein
LSAPWPDDEHWHHLAIVAERPTGPGSSTVLYVDRRIVAAVAGDGSLVRWQGHLRLGGEARATAAWRGSFEALRTFPLGTDAAELFRCQPLVGNARLRESQPESPAAGASFTVIGGESHVATRRIPAAAALPRWRSSRRLEVRVRTGGVARRVTLLFQDPHLPSQGALNVRLTSCRDGSILAERRELTGVAAGTALTVMASQDVVFVIRPAALSDWASLSDVWID